ncbi:MAG: SPFH domain-containing protein [Oscillospiraceae bacterium]|jgi:membrane protease subunit (stomatin/prohibitin family)|nr:SPFH domain-containing protein [Oscillospiraceae bacterium]
MAIIDRVKFDGLSSRDWLVYKHPSEQLVFGTQLIVGEGQIAVFVKGGAICDLFASGTYTLDAQNLPLLQRIINLPFGGKTPFAAEIYYLNTVTKLDVTWGTSDPILLVDPKYSTRLHIRAFGQMGLKLKDGGLFIQELIGVMPPAQLVRFDKLQQYFKGVIVQKIKVIIADIIINRKISALEITPHMDEISDYAAERIKSEFTRYGLDVASFYIQSINFPDEDFDAINGVLEKRAEFELMGDARYAAARTFDIYEGAANNQNGVAGAFAAGGLGLSAGLALGANVPAPPAPGGAVCPKCHSANQPGAVFCSHCGASLAVTAEPERRCPHCEAAVARDARFCPSCGKSVAPRVCPDCGKELRSGAKFCDGCGKDVSGEV